MLNLIVLILGLAIGFGGGVYWAHHNPDQAAKVAAEEEKRFLEAQLAMTEKIQAKLDQLSGKTSGGAGSTPRTGFLPGKPTVGGDAATAAEVSELRTESQKQEVELRKRLEAVK